jgi:hypothetical protein
MNAWFKDAAERAVRAFAGATVSVLVVGDGILNAFNANWGEALGVGLGGGLVSFLLSLAALKIGNDGTASLTNATVPAPGQADTPIV